MEWVELVVCHMRGEHQAKNQQSYKSSGKQAVMQWTANFMPATSSRKKNNQL